MRGRVTAIRRNIVNFKCVAGKFGKCRVLKNAKAFNHYKTVDKTFIQSTQEQNRNLSAYCEMVQEENDV